MHCLLGRRASLNGHVSGGARRRGAFRGCSSVLARRRYPGFMRDKLDIVSRHTETAIVLMALEADVASTHVLVRAAEEMLGAIATKRGVRPALDLDSLVTPKEAKKIRLTLRQVYNWLKHADRDTDEAYSGPTPESLADLNLVQTILNVCTCRVGW